MSRESSQPEKSESSSTVPEGAEIDGEVFTLPPLPLQQVVENPEVQQDDE